MYDDDDDDSDVRKIIKLQKDGQEDRNIFNANLCTELHAKSIS